MLFSGTAALALGGLACPGSALAASAPQAPAGTAQVAVAPAAVAPAAADPNAAGSPALAPASASAAAAQVPPALPGDPAGRPSLTIHKAHEEPDDHAVVYTLWVGNDGTAPSRGRYTVVDTLPDGVVATSIDSGRHWDCAPDSGRTVVTCASDDRLAPGSSSDPINLRTANSDKDPCLLVNIAGVSGGEGDRGSIHLTKDVLRLPCQHSDGDGIHVNVNVTGNNNGGHGGDSSGATANDNGHVHGITGGIAKVDARADSHAESKAAAKAKAEARARAKARHSRFAVRRAAHRRFVFHHVVRRPMVFRFCGKDC
jgi:hypothetical protein